MSISEARKSKFARAISSITSRKCIFVAAFILAFALFALSFVFLDGNLTKINLIDFVAATVTTLALALTFVLALMAVDIFATSREIEKIKNDSKALHMDIKDHAKNVDKILCILPFVIESIAERLPADAKGEEKGRDLVYFRLTHGRFLLKLLMTSDRSEQLDICRDIVGSMRENDSQEILQMTVDRLGELREFLPGDRDLIDPLLKEGMRILSAMVEQR